MTCGEGTSGCLGHGDWCSTSRPRLIEDLLRSVSLGEVDVAARSEAFDLIFEEHKVSDFVYAVVVAPVTASLAAWT